MPSLLRRSVYVALSGAWGYRGLARRLWFGYACIMAEGARHAWQCTRGAVLGGALHVLIALSPCAVTVQRPSPPLRSLGVFLGQLVSVSSRLRRVHLPLDLCTMHALTPHDLCHSIPAWAALFFQSMLLIAACHVCSPRQQHLGLHIGLAWPTPCYPSPYLSL